MTRFQIRKVLREIFNQMCQWSYCMILPNFKWHMPIYKKEICRDEQKYMPSPSVISGKIQSTEAYTNDATLRSGFFPQNTLVDGHLF